MGGRNIHLHGQDMPPPPDYSGGPELKTDKVYCLIRGRAEACDLPTGVAMAKWLDCYR
jgi:hypothetical protein